MDASDIAGIGMGATAGGALMQAFGGLASGFANYNMDNYQAAIAKLNAQIFRQDAEFARQTGEQQSLQYGLKAAATMGQIKAAQASSGFDVRSGSAQQVQASQNKLTQLDTNIIRSNAAKTAYNYETQATVADAQANVYSMAGTNSLIAGAMNFGSSLLGGIGSVSSEWLQGQRVGLWGTSSTNNAALSAGFGGQGPNFAGSLFGAN